MSSTNAFQTSLELDLTRSRVYSTDSTELKLWTSQFQKPPNLAYLNHIPIVRTLDGEKINPTNLLLYNGGHNLLLKDCSTHTLCNLDIERGVVINKQIAHNKVYTFPIEKFIYSAQNSQAQNNKYVLGFNTDTLMLFDINTGLIAQRTAYHQSPEFTALASDAQGNIFTGNAHGRIRVFSDLSKYTAAHYSPSLGAPITALSISSKGALIATTDSCFLYFPDFRKLNCYYLGEVSLQLRNYLGLSAFAPLLNAQFSGENDQLISCVVGNRLFQYDIKQLLAGEQVFTLNTVDKPILAYKRVGSSHYVLTETKPWQLLTAVQ